MTLRLSLLPLLLLPALGPASAETAAKTPPPFDPGAIVFIGSSSIDFWSSLAGDFPGETVINLGKAGTTYAHLVSHAAEWASAYPARRYVIYSGDNDIAWLSSPEKVARQFREVAETLRAGIPEVRIFVLSIKPNRALQRRMRVGTVRKANSLIETEAAALGYATYVDVHHPMLDPRGKPRDELFTFDGIHLNEGGYRLWRDILTPFLSPPAEGETRPNGGPAHPSIDLRAQAAAPIEPEPSASSAVTRRRLFR